MNGLKNNSVGPWTMLLEEQEETIMSISGT